MSMFAGTPTVRRCPETRAHYAHEWYNPLRIQCPGGPEESTTRGTDRPATAALARGLYDLDRHKWGHIGDYESLRPHYERDAERFLLPHLTEESDQ